MKPHVHAINSARRHGGRPEDYQSIHGFFDSSKACMPDVRHRALLHSSFGIFLLERVFGPTMKNSDGKLVSALMLLKEYQAFSTLPLKIHYAFIDGENDREEDVAGVLSALERWKIQCDFNIVRYNPPDDSSRESSEEKIVAAVAQMKSYGQVNVIPRVGLDVFASCGMFVRGEP